MRIPLRWPVLRQLTDADPSGRGEAARSEATERLTNRLQSADRVVKSICPYCARRVRPERLRQGRQVIQIEGDPDSPVSRGRLCPKGSATLQLTTGAVAPAPGALPAAARRPTGSALDLDTAMDMVADRVVRTASRDWSWEAGRQARPPDDGHRQPRRGDARQRGELPHQEAVHRARRRPDREPGAGLPQLDRRRSRDVVRSRRRRRRSCRTCSTPTASSSRAPTSPRPPGRLPVGHGGEGPRRDGHPRRSALHPHERAGRPARADPGRHATSRSSAGSSTTCSSNELVVPRLRRQLHQRPDLISEDFQDTEDLDGLFSGFDAETAELRPDSWQYEGDEVAGGVRRARDSDQAGAEEQRAVRPGRDARLRRPARREPARSSTRRSQHPRCVFQILKRHFARYTPEMVERVCGIAADAVRRRCAS